MKDYSEVFIGLDVSKRTHAVAVAGSGRAGEVRYLGEIDSDAQGVAGLIDRLGVRHKRLHFCYEAGPTGYGLYRQIRAAGHDCVVVAPSTMPRKPGDRVKTNRRDAMSLARLHRSGELSSIWVPDAVHEAVRDLVRAREAISLDLHRKRQQLLSFLLRHGQIYSGSRHWSRAHLLWLTDQRFDHPAQQIVFQDMIDAISDAGVRLRRLEEQLTKLVPQWSMAPFVAAYQAMRGVSFIVAVTFVSEIGDPRRFPNPRQLAAFIGLVPSERSTGDRVRRGSLTLAGNKRVRRVLIEGARTYRYPARVSRTLQARLDGVPKAVREIAWKAQVRLCARYRRMTAAGKKSNLVVAAIAREMAAFLWSIGQHIAPDPIRSSSLSDGAAPLKAGPKGRRSRG